MQTRESDHVEGAPLVRITRDIPLPWILGALALLAVQAASLYFGQVDLSKRTSEMAADIKQIKEEVNRTGIKNIEIAYQVGDLNRRVMVLESQGGRGGK